MTDHSAELLRISRLWNKWLKPQAPCGMPSDVAVLELNGATRTRPSISKGMHRRDIGYHLRTRPRRTTSMSAQDESVWWPTFSTACSSAGLIKSTARPSPLETPYSTTEDWIVEKTFASVSRFIEWARYYRRLLTVARRMAVSSWPKGGLITTRTKTLIIKATRAQHRPTPVATATHPPWSLGVTWQNGGRERTGVDDIASDTIAVSLMARENLPNKDRIHHRKVSTLGESALSYRQRTGGHILY